MLVWDGLGICILIKRETIIGIFRFLGAGYLLAAQVVAFASVATRFPSNHKDFHPDLSTCLGSLLV